VRGKLAQRIRDSIEPEVRPGEEVHAVAHAYNLSFPWWVGLMILEYGLLLLIATPYYLGLTGDRLIFRKVSRLSSKRTEPGFSYPLESLSVDRFRKGIMWGKATLRAPDRKLRLKFARHSRDEMVQIVNALGRGSGEGAAA